MANQIEATRHHETYQPPLGVPCWHAPEDAAQGMGVSVRAVRRAARAAGVKRIRGRAVAGMVEMARGDRRGFMPYAD